MRGWRVAYTQDLSSGAGYYSIIVINNGEVLPIGSIRMPVIRNQSYTGCEIDLDTKAMNEICKILQARIRRSIAA